MQLAFGQFLICDYPEIINCIFQEMVFTVLLQIIIWVYNTIRICAFPDICISEGVFPRENQPKPRIGKMPEKMWLRRIASRADFPGPGAAGRIWGN
ncbi:MAG: hypothetical protein ACKO85_16760 [Isosphaeraceae bacterium]